MSLSDLRISFTTLYNSLHFPIFPDSSGDFEGAAETNIWDALQPSIVIMTSRRGSHGKTFEEENCQKLRSEKVGLLAFALNKALLSGDKLEPHQEEMVSNSAIDGFQLGSGHLRHRAAQVLEHSAERLLASFYMRGLERI